MIRRMWHLGVAHRDIKPANLMVQDGHLRLIDVFFVQVRPSPWRQAVDLANMMLVLALRSDAQTVYEHALQDFTPDEIAEAFAAARGVASPTQLRNLLKADERGLVDEFRRLGASPRSDPDPALEPPPHRVDRVGRAAGVPRDRLARVELDGVLVRLAARRAAATIACAAILISLTGCTTSAGRTSRTASAPTGS